MYEQASRGQASIGYKGEAAMLAAIPVSAVQGSMNKLQDQISELEVLVSELRAKLAPVSLPRMEQAIEGRIDAPSSCQMEEEVRIYTARIQVINLSLAEAKNSLCI